MLRKLIFVVIALFVGFGLHAQQAADTGITRNINFVDSSYILDTCDIGREINRRFNERRDELRQKEAEISKRLNNREEELTKLRDTMTQSEFTPLAEEFDRESEQERSNIDQLSQQLIADHDAQLARLGKRVLNEVQELAFERNLDAIFDVRQTVTYNSELDLSQLIIGRLNESYRLNKTAIDEEIYAPASTNSGLTGPSETGTSIIQNQTGGTAQ